MFCPGCGSEYETGVETCSECGVALVTELPEDFQAKYQELVTVFEAINNNELAVAESLLQGAEIPYVVQGAGSQGIFGAGSTVLGKSHIDVKPEFADAALELLADLDEEVDDETLEEYEEE